MDLDVPPGHALRLDKALYGLKQAAHEWFAEMCTKLASIGMVQLHKDVALFVCVRSANDTVALATWVDNMIITSNSPAIEARFRQELHDLFNMTDEDPSWVLGLELIRDREAGTIALSQRQYIETLLGRFDMLEFKPAELPMTGGTYHSRAECPQTKQDIQDMYDVPYRSLVGGLMWAAVMSRPDIAFNASHLAQFLHNPGLVHWKSAQHVLRYLGSTMDYALDLVLNCDASYGNDRDDSRSISGYVVSLDGASIAWSSKKQSSVALSSTEAEYMALSHALREAIYLDELLDELGVTHPLPIPLFSDSTGALALAKNDKRNHGRAKHIRIRYDQIRDEVKRGFVEVKHRPGSDMPADMLTKALPIDKFRQFREAVRVRKI
jgi:hypothetical protein